MKRVRSRNEPGSPIRVLHVFHELRRSGAESMMYSARDLWAEQGVECELVAVGGTAGDFAPDLAARGYPIHRLAPSRTALLTGFAALMRKRRPDVVHIHTERAGFWLALISRLHGARVVQSVHSIFSFTGTLRWERRMQRRIARRLGVTFVAVGLDVADNEMERFGNTTEVVWNWVDLERFSPPTAEQRARSRRALGVQDSDVVVITVGNCWSLKNHTLVIEAMDLPSMPSDVVYLHVGDHSIGVGADERRRAARQEREGRVRFLGVRSDVAELLGAADLFVMPSDLEGGTVAAIEALATDTPVLLGDSPGLRDFRQLSDSVRLTRLDPAAIAAGITEFCRSRSTDPPDGRYRSIATRWFDPRRGTARYCALYRRTTSNGPR
ncbi:MAG: glycosyltransferase [Acidimicrobiia bacterium]|nr:glycosyltransferase [Acidimicrobiia bacterium]